MINESLDIYRERLSHDMYKQQMRKIDILEIFQAEGYDIGYTTDTKRSL